MFAKPSDDFGRLQVPVGGPFRQLVYGLVVESSFPLDSIDGAPDGAALPDIRLTLVPPDFFRLSRPDLAAGSDDWIEHAVLPDGSIYMKLEGIFETVVAACGGSVVCAQLGDADQRSFEANLLNFVLSTALTLRGEEPLHATVLEIDGRAFGLLGPSGTGKSTLAAALIARGAGLITDDMLRLTFDRGQGFAHYGPHRLKLLDDAAQRLMPRAIGAGHFNALSGKIMVQPPADSAPRRSPRPLAALLWLGDAPPIAGPVCSKRLAGVELVRTLTASAMNIRYFAPDRLARQLRFAERVARTVPVYALTYARRFEDLDRVIFELRRAVGG